MLDKTKIIRPLVFVLLGIIILNIIFYLIEKGVRNSDFEQTGKVNKIANHSIDPEIIVFGSSVSEVGVVPSIVQQKTKMTTYNCSINGTRFLQYKGLIDEFASYSKTNKYVVFVETYFSFEKIDVLTMSEYFLQQVNNDNIYKALYEIQPDLVWRSRYIPFYKYTTVSYKYYKNVFFGWKRMKPKSLSSDSLSGYSPVDRAWEADADEAIRNTPKFDIQIDSNIVEKYIATINKLQGQQKKVILVLTPMFTEMLRQVTDMSPLRAKLNKIAQSTGARFIDYSGSDICNNKALFYNSNHLNRRGAQTFSRALGDTLLSIIKADNIATSSK